MKNQFEDVMAKRTTEELLKIVNGNSQDYLPEAMKIAEQEIKKRKILKEKLSTVSDKELLEFLKLEEKYKYSETFAIAATEAKKRNLITFFIEEKSSIYAYARKLIVNYKMATDVILKKLLEETDISKEEALSVCENIIHKPNPTRDMPSLGSLNGFGSTFHGSTKEWKDGSYIATIWIVIFFIPFIPIGSYRILPTEGGARMFGFASEYEVFSKEKLDKGHVVKTYLILFSVIAIITLIATL